MAIVESLLVAVLQIITLTQLCIHRRNKVVSLQNKQTSQVPISNITHAGTTTQVRIKISAKVEYKMVISILCLAFVMMLKIIFYIWLLFSGSFGNAFQFFIFVTDIFSLLNPILLLGFSKYTRKMLADFVFHGKTYSV
jgi:hypothetical protein